METEKQRIEELVKQLNAASAAYYNGQDEITPATSATFSPAGMQRKWAWKKKPDIL